MLTDIQMQVLDGAMLGDGNLSCRHKNAELRYTSKSKEHIEFIGNYFKNYLCPKSYSVKTYIHPKTDNSYTSYKLRTSQNVDLTVQYYRWYGTNNHKEIPLNLVLTPLTCLIWYIGDGTLSNGGRGQELKLCTNSFNVDKLNQIVIPQLQDFNAHTRKLSDHTNQYHVIIPHRKIKDFLTYIGPNPIQDYAHKWKYSEYKNKMSFRNYKQQEQTIIDLYRHQNITYYRIAKMLNMDPSLVRYYLKKNNIFNKGDKYAI